ncbi:putative inactive receptor kinase [Canna indica]|uniref:Inactive receptor kinase n=1 Tax=Canna indica TaxID=4628 RepID=A0AAQ3QLS5_9LILI|nr:putative inactive receptor kinase [Canna indica]
MASPLLLLLPTAFLLFVPFLPGDAADLASDEAALLAFRGAVGRSVLSTWNSSAANAPCSWQGVTCESGRVVSLRLPGAGLIGRIPAALGNLTALRTLSLRFNALSGPLPPEISGLAELRNLYLHGNRLTGDIPSFIASMKDLVRLNLAGNQFTGEIPPELNNLTRLGTLYLENNRLTGQIPALDLPNLVQFNVSYNQLNGSIPAKLRSQPAVAFLATGLCGGPLGLCPGEIAPSPSSEGPAAGNAGAGEDNNNSKKKKKLSGGAIAGIAIGAAALLLIALVVLVLLCRGRKDRSSKARAVASEKQMEMAEAAEEERDNGLGKEGRANGNSSAAAPPAVAAAKAATSASSGAKKLVFFGKEGPRPFDLEDLLRASAEVLGKGTFGTAYKAVLESGLTVAVKRLKDVNSPEHEFKEKIEIVGAMDHPNLVPLMAYYFSKDEKLLVYEYMPMGSLSALLHGNRGSGRTPLNWETRTSIALAAAQGIEYIHSKGPSSSHGNIKSSNILLTRSYGARVSDHGLALLVGSNTTTARVAGYRAPEVTDPRKVSQKADIYSFGVLLLELLTGRAPQQAILNDEGIDLPRWVQSVVREEWTAEVFDVELLRYQNVEEDMVQLLQLSIDCVAQYPDKRPPMTEVMIRIDEIRKSSLGSSYRDQQSTPQSIEDDDDRSPGQNDSNGGSKPPTE